MIHFRSYQDLNRTIIENLHKIPADTDLIVGIPRSGLMAANLLALHLHLPLTDIEGFKNRRIISSGKRLNGSPADFSKFKNVLIIDDSLFRGTEMNKAKNQTDGIYPGKNLTFCAVYMNPDFISKADLHFELCPLPRVFEWNVMNHPFIKKACMDIDGVLCKAPTPEENDDGPEYHKFLKNAVPHLRTKVKVGVLVTNRLEKYRKETEQWLSENNIRFEKLIMRDFTVQNTRREANDYGKFKGKVFAIHTKSKLFIEGSLNQSKEIVRISGKPAYCVDKQMMIWPGQRAVIRRKANSFAGRIKKKVFRRFGSVSITI